MMNRNTEEIGACLSAEFLRKRVRERGREREREREESLALFPHQQE